MASGLIPRPAGPGDAAAAPRITVNATLSAVPVYARLGFTATDAVQSVDGLAFLPMVFKGDVAR